MLNPQAAPDFSDSRLEWRRMFAECLGTFLLVLVAAGGGVVEDLSRGSVSLAMIVVAPGLMVVAIIYFMGTVSGARTIGTNGALAIGAYIALAGLWAAPISGASMNRVFPASLRDRVS
jgi:glycerol uptake facilitator-like aquaporin